MRRCNHIFKLSILIIMYVAQNSTALAYTIELTEKEVQKAVERYFPIEQTMPFATLKLHNPVVFFDQRSNRIGLGVSVAADIPGFVTGNGYGVIDGDLEYRQETGEFYLRDPKVKRVEIENFPAETIATIHQLLEQIARQSLPVILVYQFKDDDLGQRMAQSMLNSVTVNSGKLVLELTAPGFNPGN